MSVTGERINDIMIGGDFFGAKDISGLEELIRGKKFSELRGVESDEIIGSYILGMTANELMELLEN